MPPLGQTSDELRLSAWLKSEGENVAEGEPLLEVETDKATLEVEASVSGTLLRTMLTEGETVLAGTLVGWIGEPGEQIPDAEEPARKPPASPERPASTEQPRSSTGEYRVLATPAARTLAKELGIELAHVSGSGPGGRIERRDVEPEPVSGLDQPVSRIRQAIAGRLVRTTSVPQFTLSRTIDARAALELTEQVEGLTLTHLLLRAVGTALVRVAGVNRIWVEEGPRLRVLEKNNVGLAIASDDNLIVATIPEPDGLSLEELVQTTRRAVDEGRAGRLPAAFTEPAAVTVSNLGMFGVDRFEAIVDPGQTAVLAVGRVVERPAVTDAGIAAVKQLDLTLTVDHRTVDGAEAARFLAAICEQLEARDPDA
jgi:pyruvate dehydrogenase E2 component (dihydrolipoamide acetyltransferase)